MRTSTKLSIVLGGCATLVATTWIATRARVDVANDGARATVETDASEIASVERVPAALASETTSANEAKERVADVAEIRGRLIDATTGAPIAGRTIELRAKTRPFASAFAALAFANASSVPQRFFLGGSGGAIGRAFQYGGLSDRSVNGLQDADVQADTDKRFALSAGAFQLLWTTERDGFEPRLVPVEVPPPQDAPLTEAVPPQEETSASETGSAPEEASLPVQIVLTDVSDRVQASETVLTELMAERVRGQLLVDLHVAQQNVLDVARARALGESFRMSTPDVNAVRLDVEGLVWTPTPVEGAVRAAMDAAARSASAAPTLPVRTTTDANGWFRFDCPADPDVELVLIANDGEWLPDATYSFAGLDSPCRETIEWRVEIAAGRAVTGRVLDARTLEPLSGITLSIAGERGRHERADTDADGRFTTDGSFPLGHVAIELSDGDDPARIDATPREAELAVARTGDELVVLASIGPTFRFTFAHADVEDGAGKRIVVHQEHDANDVEARFVGAEPWPGVAEAAGLEPSANPFADWRRVRQGSPVASEDVASSSGWLRYAIAPKLPRAPRVELRTTNANYACTIELASGSGVQDVVLQRTAVVRGRVTFTTTEPDTSAYRVVAARAGGGRGAAYASAPCGVDGTFELEGLDATAVRALELWKGDERVRILDLELAPGETRTIDIEL